MNTSPEPRSGFAFEPLRFPEALGCYLLKDSGGQALFVGMAKNLRRLLSGFFDGSLRPSDEPLPGRSRYLDVRPQMLARIAEIEIILVENETDCTNLVNALIERLRPHYNLATFSDPFGTSYILQTGEEFARFLPVAGRRVAKKALPRGVTAAATFGPYPSAVRDALLKCVNQAFELRTCAPLPSSACLSFTLKKCSAPCEQRISAVDYAARVGRAADLLAAPTAALLEELHSLMQAAAQSLDFERARLLRDLAAELQEAAAGQLAEGPTAHDQDVIWVGQGKALILHLKMGRLDSLSECAAPTGEEDIAAFLSEHYRRDCPPELILPPLSGVAVIGTLLTTAAGHPVTINTGQDARARDLLRAAQANHAYRVSGRLPEPVRRVKRVSN